MRKANTMRIRSTCFLMTVIAVLSLSVTPAPLWAQGSCRISVDTILAARNGAKIDPRLRRHIDELQSMFNYTSYRLLDSERLNLKVGQSGTVSLPGDRRLKITPHKIHGGRADIALRMMKKRRTVFQSQIQLLNRGSLFVGGPRYLNGNLIFKISSSY